MYWKLLDYRYVFYGGMLEDFVAGCQGLTLDAGCGRKGGSLSFATSVGVDLGRQNVKSSKLRRPQTSFIIADITHLPFRKAIFDLVVSVDVLEHVEGKEAAIKEISRVSKLGAFFVGSTSNLLNPVFIFDSFGPKRVVSFLAERYAKGHYERHFRFTSATLGRTLQKAGFATNVIHLLGFPPFTPWIFQNDPSLKPPWFARLWIIVDKLMTKVKPLSQMKEAIVFRAVRSPSSPRQLSRS